MRAAFEFSKEAKRLPSVDGLVHCHGAINAYCSLEICYRPRSSRLCARRCLDMQLPAHTTVGSGLATDNKGPLRDGSTCTGRK